MQIPDEIVKEARFEYLNERHETSLDAMRAALEVAVRWEREESAREADKWESAKAAAAAIRNRSNPRKKPLYF